MHGDKTTSQQEIANTQCTLQAQCKKTKDKMLSPSVSNFFLGQDYQVKAGQFMAVLPTQAVSC